MKRKLWAAILLSLTAAAAVELVFVPTVGVLASPPNASLTTCVASPPFNSTSPHCTFATNYYSVGGPPDILFSRRGGALLEGVYYPLTQPAASPAREIGNVLCPAMHR